jgi:hypothetical protein
MDIGKQHIGHIPDAIDDQEHWIEIDFVLFENIQNIDWVPVAY